MLSCVASAQRDLIMKTDDAKYHNSLKKKVIRLGDFLHLGRNVLSDYSKADYA